MYQTTVVCVTLLMWLVPASQAPSNVAVPDFLHLEQVWNNTHLQGAVNAPPYIEK